MSATEKRPLFAFVIAMQFVFGLAIASFTILPSVVVRHHRGTVDAVGPYTGSLAIGSLLAAPIAGFLLDRVGRRNIILAGGFGGALAASLFAIYLDVRSIALPMLVVVGVTFTMVVNGVSALVADLADEAFLARAIGWQGAASMIAGAISPSLGEALAPRLGWHAPFYGAALIGVVIMAMALRLPRDRPLTPEASRSFGPSLRALVPVMLVSVLAGASFTTIATYHQPHLLALGAESVRAYFIGFSAGALVMRLGFGSLPDRLGLVRANRLALMAYAIVALSYLVITPSTLVFGGFAHGVVHGVFYPSIVALGFRTVSHELRGLAASFTLGAFNLGSALASFAFGELAHATSTRTVFVVGALCSALAITLVRAPAEEREVAH